MATRATAVASAGVPLHAFPALSFSTRFFAKAALKRHKAPRSSALARRASRGSSTAKSRPTKRDTYGAATSTAVLASSGFTRAPLPTASA